MNPGNWYVRKGETERFEIIGVRVGNEEAEPMVWVDGSALCALVYAEEAETDQPLVLKQFGASDLLLAGLTPDVLDPGQVVEIARYEGGGYSVEIGPDDVEGAADAM